jgi:hypothetical protein
LLQQFCVHQTGFPLIVNCVPGDHTNQAKTASRCTSIPGRKKNGGPKAAAVAEMLTAYAPLRPAGLSHPAELKHDQPIISNRTELNGTDQLRIDILLLDLLQNIH